MGDSKKTILIIDDDKSILKTFRRLLQRCGYEVDVAETGAEAVEKLNNRFYDVALIDVRLPDMDGGDLLVLARKELSNTVKMIITGLPMIDLGNKTLEQGADALLLKPVKPEELISLIQDKLKKKSL